MSILKSLVVLLLAFGCAEAHEPAEPATAQITICESPCLTACLADSGQQPSDCYEICARHASEDVCRAETVAVPSAGVVK